MNHYCHVFTFDVVKLEAELVISPVCADCGRRRPCAVKP